MKSNVLTVVIEEREPLERIEDVTFVSRMSNRARHMNTTGRVFKDYILSSEIFHIDASVN
jgi:hypothetical protein